MDQEIIDNTFSYIMAYIQRLKRGKYSLQIPGDILLKDGIICCIGHYDPLGLNILNTDIIVVRKYIYDSLMNDEIPMYTIEWYMNDPVSITSDHIIDIFNDHTIFEIYCTSEYDQYAHYYVSETRDMSNLRDNEDWIYHVFERFERIIYVDISPGADTHVNKIYVTYRFPQKSNITQKIADRVKKLPKTHTTSDTPSPSYIISSRRHNRVCNGVGLE